MVELGHKRGWALQGRLWQRAQPGCQHLRVSQTEPAELSGLAFILRLLGFWWHVDRFRLGGGYLRYRGFFRWILRYPVKQVRLCGYRRFGCRFGRVQLDQPARLVRPDEMPLAGVALDPDRLGEQISPGPALDRGLEKQKRHSPRGHWPPRRYVRVWIALIDGHRLDLHRASFLASRGLAFP